MTKQELIYAVEQIRQRILAEKWDEAWWDACELTRQISWQTEGYRERMANKGFDYSPINKNELLSVRVETEYDQGGGYVQSGSSCPFSIASGPISSGPIFIGGMAYRGIVSGSFGIDPIHNCGSVMPAALEATKQMNSANPVNRPPDSWTPIRTPSWACLPDASIVFEGDPRFPSLNTGSTSSGSLVPLPSEDDEADTPTYVPNPFDKEWS